MADELKTNKAVRKAVNNYYNKLTAYDRTKQQAKTFVRKHAQLDDLKELIRVYNDSYGTHLFMADSDEL